MDQKDRKLLKNLGIYMHPELRRKYDHKHSNPENWVRFYYYKQKKPFLVPRSNIRYEAEVTSTNSLHKHTFYKMSFLSKSDPYYDYYYKLKENIDKVIVLENQRVQSKKNFKTIKAPPPERNSEGQFVVRFE